MARYGKTHGLFSHPLYQTWWSMMKRCNDPCHQAYPRYGGRGIKVCERWRTIQNFIADMGVKPSPDHTLDREDNDKGYEPGNVRWATRKEQVRNRSNAWTDDQDADLRAGLEAGKTYGEVAAKIGTTMSAAVARAGHLGLKAHKRYVEVGLRPDLEYERELREAFFAMEDAHEARWKAAAVQSCHGSEG